MRKSFVLLVIVAMLAACIIAQPMTAFATSTNGNEAGHPDVGIWYTPFYFANQSGSRWAYDGINYRPWTLGSYQIYDSANTQVIDEHLANIAAAKIDFILLDETNGGCAGYEMANSSIWTNYTDAICRRVAYWDANPNNIWKIKVAFAIGTWFTSDADVGNCIEQQAHYINDNFTYNSNYGFPNNIYCENGQALLVVFDYNHNAQTDWNNFGGKGYGNNYTIRYAGSAGQYSPSYGWVNDSNGTVLNSEEELVMPGWNNHQGSTPVMRNYGDYYVNSWNWILDNTLPRIVMISSFNDYGEDNAIWTADTSTYHGGSRWPIEQWTGHDGQFHNSMYWDYTVGIINSLRYGTARPTMAGSVSSGGSVSLYNNTSGQTAVQINSGDKAAEKFTAISSFNEVDVQCPSYNNNIGNLTMKLYSWNTDYNTTVAGTPIASQTFVNFSDNAYLNLTFSAQASGTYLWTLSDPDETVGVWKYPNSTDPAGAFWNGSSVTGDYTSQYVTVTAPPSSSTVNLYNNTSGQTAVQINSGDKAAEKFTATSSFNEVDVQCPSYNNNIGNLTMKLYPWNTDYNTTVAGTPIASQTFVNFSDNAYLNLTFSAQASGTYLWTLSDPDETVGVWKYPNSTDPAGAFWNGSAVAGDYTSQYVTP